MTGVKKFLQSIVIVLPAVLAFSQAAEDSIEFHFDSNAGSTTYRSSCHNFTIKRQFYEVTISAFNGTEGFMQCLCSLRSYAVSSVTVEVVSGDNNIEYRLEDNSAINFKLTYSDAIVNGYLYVLNSEGLNISPDGVIITSNGGFVDLSCSNTTYPWFASPQPNIAASTVSLFLWTSTQGNEGSGQNSNDAFYAAIAILGVVTTLLLGLVALLCIFGRRKLVLLQNRLMELSPSSGSGVEAISQSRAACGVENSTEHLTSKSDTSYEDVSNIDKSRDTTLSTAPAQCKPVTMPQQPNGNEGDVLKGKTNFKETSPKYPESTSKGVSSMDVRLYEPLDVYVNAEEQPPQNTSAEYAQLNRTIQPS